jgi:predicted SAM-dependent methyltransferase
LIEQEPMLRKLQRILDSRRQTARLRRLQRDYYAADTKDELIILDYLRTLAEVRARWLHVHALPSQTCVHLGAGDHRLEGWMNLDIIFNAQVDAVADLTRSLPFRSESVDFIHSEDFLEHVDYGAGQVVLDECYRVLRPGGVMRLLMPDLESLVERIYLRREEHHLRWCQVQLDARGPCESLNMHLRMNGEHRFIYDRDLIQRLLGDRGFDVGFVRWNESKHPRLRFLDLRDFGLNLFVEARKPDR